MGDYTQDKLVKYAGALNLNLQEFEACLSEGKHKKTVEQDAAQAQAAGGPRHADVLHQRVQSRRRTAVSNPEGIH